MSRFLAHSSGAPTFTAVSANLNLSGFEDLSPLSHPSVSSSARPSGSLAADSLLDAAEWYHAQPHHGHQHQHQQQRSGQGHVGHSQPHAAGSLAHRPQLSPTHEHFPVSPLYGPAFGSASHPAAVTSGDLRGPQYSTVNRSMSNHFSLGPDRNGQTQQFDEIVLSPLQTNFSHNGNAYQTPYPDSTASSAPSEDLLTADADEDKRKRNQAASARFRQKKKQREAQMLEQSRDMQDRFKRLEAEIDTLRRENVFLKRLLVEKVDNMSADDRELLAKTADATAKARDG